MNPLPDHTAAAFFLRTTPERVQPILDTLKRMGVVEPSGLSKRRKDPAMKQRDLMRQLFQEHGGAEGPILRAYAEAEQQGRVARDSNSYDLTPQQYAKALFKDGVRKGWIERPVRSS